MKLWSDSWTNGDRIGAAYAAGRLDANGGVGFSDNLNPHLAWSELPAATKSLVLICHDFDVPSKGDDVNQADREVPSDLPRVDFFHWLLVDLPPTVASIAAKSIRYAFAQRRLHGARQTRPGRSAWRAPGPERLQRLVRGPRRDGRRLLRL